MKAKILTVVIIFAFVFSVFSQEQQSLEEYFNSEIIKVSYPFGSGVSLNVNGTTSTIGWRLSPVISNMLNQYPTSKVSFEQYKKENRTGNVLLWSGLGGMMASTLVFSYKNSDVTGNINFSDPVNVVSFSGIFIGSIIEVVGAFIMSSGYEDLFNSINQYNLEKIKEYK